MFISEEFEQMTFAVQKALAMLKVEITLYIIFKSRTNSDNILVFKTLFIISPSSAGDVLKRIC